MAVKNDDDKYYEIRKKAVEAYIKNYNDAMGKKISRSKAEGFLDGFDKGVGIKLDEFTKDFDRKYRPLNREGLKWL